MKFERLSTLAAFVGVLATSTASAGVSFSPLQPLAATAASDNDVGSIRGDHSPTVARSASGTVIAAWVSSDLSVPDDTDPDVVYCRSTDGGATWSPPSFFYPQPITFRASSVEVATSGSGLWLGALNRADQTVITRSTDEGITWSEPVQVSSNEPFGYLSGEVTLRIADGGTVIAVWAAIDTDGDDTDLYFSRSTDLGLSWSPQALLTPEDGYHGPGASNPRIETDGAGTWIVAYDRITSPHLMRSTDDGQTWTPINNPWTGGASLDTDPDVVYHPSGAWIVMWTQVGYIPVGGGRTLFSRSTDGGLTWTEQASVTMPEQNLSVFDGPRPRIQKWPDGRLTAIWGLYEPYGATKGWDTDLAASDSYDGGLTWDPPMLVNSTARTDERGVLEQEVAIAATGADSMVAIWSSIEDLNGTIGDDLDILYARSIGDCPASPAPGCLRTLVPAASRIAIKDGKGGRDKLVWRWRRGEDTSSEDLGDPATSSSYAFCLYAKAGGQLRNVMEEDVPAATSCGALPCWAVSPPGFVYRDRETLHGSARTMRLLPGTDESADVELKAAGPFLGPPSLPIDLSVPLVAQLHNTETGACWQATFSSASTNDSATFKATSD